MSDQTLEVQKQEMTAADDSERTREGACFTPRADVYETEDALFVVADVPGVDENSLDIVLEKNVLTINGYVDPEPQAGLHLAYAEYEVGDYQRSFRLSDEIDRDGIEALVKDGILRLRLPKSTAAKSRKISVRVG